MRGSLEVYSLARKGCKCCVKAGGAGTPDQIAEVLPALMANLRMVHAMSRHYSAPVRLAALLQKIARQVRHSIPLVARTLCNNWQRACALLTACKASRLLLEHPTREFEPWHCLFHV